MIERWDEAEPCPVCGAAQGEPCDVRCEASETPYLPATLIEEDDGY